MKGHFTPHSEDTKKKISESKKQNPTRYWLGKKRPEETIRKMSLSKIGGTPWNKGMVGVQVAWNKGKKVQTNTGRTHFKKGHTLTEGHKQRISVAQKGNKHALGNILSIETRKKMGVARSGANAWNWKEGISTGENKKKYSSYQTRLRKARKREAEGTHSFAEWENLKAQYNWTCPCCKKQEPDIVLTADHIIPLTKGGSNNIENIQPLCRSCNSKKYTKTIFYPNI